MTPEAYIDALLEKYRKVPDFPFTDWVENSSSFSSLVNLWDEIIASAAGEYQHRYQATGEVVQNVDSPRLYQAVSPEARKKLYISHESEGGVFFFGNSEDDRQKPLSYFEIVSDLQRDRLVCAFKMICEYTHTPLPPKSKAVERLDRQFTQKYAKYFGYPGFNPFTGEETSLP